MANMAAAKKNDMCRWFTEKSSAATKMALAWAYLPRKKSQRPLWSAPLTMISWATHDTA